MEREQRNPLPPTRTEPARTKQATAARCRRPPAAEPYVVKQTRREIECGNDEGVGRGSREQTRRRHPAPGCGEASSGESERIWPPLRLTLLDSAVSGCVARPARVAAGRQGRRRQDEKRRRSEEGKRRRQQWGFGGGRRGGVRDLGALHGEEGFGAAAQTNLGKKLPRGLFSLTPAPQ